MIKSFKSSIIGNFETKDYGLMVLDIVQLFCVIRLFYREDGGLDCT